MQCRRHSQSASVWDMVLCGANCVHKSLKTIRRTDVFQSSSGLWQNRKTSFQFIVFFFVHSLLYPFSHVPFSMRVCIFFSEEKLRPCFFIIVSAATGYFQVSKLLPFYSFCVNPFFHQRPSLGLHFSFNSFFLSFLLARKSLLLGVGCCFICEFFSRLALHSYRFYVAGQYFRPFFIQRPFFFFRRFRNKSFFSKLTTQ